MNKKIKDVFFNCALEDNKFIDANVEEIKFSKKLNAVILSTKSEDSIPLWQIEEFEKKSLQGI